MTADTLENKIAEKFVSIISKLRNIILKQMLQNCAPSFKILIMICMDIMEKEKISFHMNFNEQNITNQVLCYLGVPGRIRSVSNSSCANESYGLMNYNLGISNTHNTDNQKRINFYNFLDTIDNLLSLPDVGQQLRLIEELALQCEQEYKANND
jgi:hypothetical protein